MKKAYLSKVSGSQFLNILQLTPWQLISTVRCKVKESDTCYIKHYVQDTLLYVSPIKTKTISDQIRINTTSKIILEIRTNTRQRQKRIHNYKQKILECQLKNLIHKNGVKITDVTKCYHLDDRYLCTQKIKFSALLLVVL